jgi:site-specific DNA-methyltransferase (adenine-specific)
MVNYSCDNCSKVFKQKGHLEVHKNRKLPCKKDNTIEQLVEKKVQEALAKTNATALKIEPLQSTNAMSNEMDYTKKTVPELKALCKERKIKGISGKSKTDLIAMLEPPTNIVVNTIESVPAAIAPTNLRQDVIHGDTIKILPTLDADSAQIIIADPPYNIGKDFGNDSDKQPMDEYLLWCEQWIKECLRVLKPNGTMFIYGFSEILALILSKVPYNINRRWIVWHYTNKNVPSLNFWQRSHESVIVLWKSDKVFHRDDIREAYTEGFLNGAAGKERKATKGRFSKGDKKTTYTAHANGALPRDVIKIPALAGGAGMNERVDHPTQKPLALCDKLIRSCKQSATDGYVLVPFAGSGSECLAAKNIGLPFVGIELNADYVKLINERLKDKPTEQTPVVLQSS